MLTNFGIVEPGLYRCAQPDAKGFADLKALGVGIAVKLNDDTEYPLERERREFDGIVEGLPLSTFRPDANAVRALAHLIEAHRPKALDSPSLVIHCSHGRDRTGLAVGAWRLLCCKWSLGQVEAERRLYGNVWILDLVDHEIVECLKALAGTP